jgi:hypothetical protein
MRALGKLQGAPHGLRTAKTKFTKYVFSSGERSIGSPECPGCIFSLTFGTEHLIYVNHEAIFRDRKSDVRENQSMKNATKKAAKKAPAKKAAPKKKK